MLGMNQATNFGAQSAPLYSGTPPFFAFEFSETSGSTVSDTGTAANGRTAPLNASSSLVDITPYGRGIEFVDTTNGGLLVSGSDVILPVVGNRAIEMNMLIDPASGLYANPVQFRGTTYPVTVLVSDQSGYYHLGVSGIAVGATKTVGSASYRTSTWLHFVANLTGVNDIGEGMQVNGIYVDSVSKVIAARSAWAAGYNETRLGSGYDNGALRRLKGKLGYVRVYDYHLTQAQINELYALRGV